MGTGNALNNVLTGNDAVNELNGEDGDDTLDGGLNDDVMRGGAGNDTYVVGQAGDLVHEEVGAGTDIVRSSITLALGDNVENLTLTGSNVIDGTGNALNNVLTGNSAINVLTGGDGNDTLDGGSGNDQLAGGAGNDTYVVAQVGDSVAENANEGIDLVQASVAYTIGDHVENLTLTGSAAINGSGNALDNVLTGNGGSNTLTGGAGNDTLNGGSAGTDSLIGGTGNDTYIVTRTSGITITESAGEGIDTVQSSVTHTLSSNVENLSLTGSSAISGTGNTLDNVLMGNASNNTLTGSSGNDTLDGGSAGTDSLVAGAGNDIYIVGRTSGITVTENASEGTDIVQASVSYTLGSNVENLTLTGTSAINGAGNTLSNVVVGNGGNNTLTGAAGNDTLTGGNGADIYSYSSGHGSDTIDNSSGDTAQDRLNLTNLTRSQMTLTRSGNDLVMTRNGTPTDSVRVTNWFTVTGNQLDFVQFTDQTLTSAQINSLFGGSLTSASVLPEPAMSDEWDRSASRFVDAMNHFGADRHRVIEQEIRNEPGQQFELLSANAAERSIHLWRERSLVT